MNHWEEIPSELNGINREFPFRAPKDYFKDFPARLQMKIDQSELAEGKSRSRFIEKIKPALSLAAAFAAVFMLVYWPVSIVNKNLTSGSEKQLNDTSTQYDLINLIEQIDDNTYYTLLTEEPSSSGLETETLADFLHSVYSDYDILIETFN